MTMTSCLRYTQAGEQAAAKSGSTCERGGKQCTATSGHRRRVSSPKKIEQLRCHEERPHDIENHHNAPKPSVRDCHHSLLKRNGAIL